MPPPRLRRLRPRPGRHLPPPADAGSRKRQRALGDRAPDRARRGRRRGRRHRHRRHRLEQADAKTLTLDPVSALGRNPFTPSAVAKLGTPISSLQIPTDLRTRIPAQLIGQTQPTDISQSDWSRSSARSTRPCSGDLNPAIGALSTAEAPLSVPSRTRRTAGRATINGTRPGSTAGRSCSRSATSAR